MNALLRFELSRNTRVQKFRQAESSVVSQSPDRESDVPRVVRGIKPWISPPLGYCFVLVFNVPSFPSHNTLPSSDRVELPEKWDNCRLVLVLD